MTSIELLNIVGKALSMNPVLLPSVHLQIISLLLKIFFCFLCQKLLIHNEHLMPKILIIISFRQYFYFHFFKKDNNAT